MLARSEVLPLETRWVRLRARFEGPEVEVSIEGQPVAKVRLPRGARGRCGLLKFYNSPIHFRAWRAE